MIQQDNNSHLELIVNKAIHQWAESPSPELTLGELCKIVREKRLPSGGADIHLDQKVSEIFHRLHTLNQNSRQPGTFDCHLSILISGKVYRTVR